MSLPQSSHLESSPRISYVENFPLTKCWPWVTAGADEGAISPTVATAVPAKQALINGRVLGLKGAPHWAVSLGVTDAWRDDHPAGSRIYRRANGSLTVPSFCA